MHSVGGALMASGRKKTKKDESEAAVKLVRINVDLAEMLSWIVKVKGGTVAEFLDPLIRPQVTTAYKQIEAVVLKAKKVEEEMKRIRDQAQE